MQSTNVSVGVDIRRQQRRRIVPMCDVHAFFTFFFRFVFAIYNYTFEAKHFDRRILCEPAKWQNKKRNVNETNCRST